jgi:hypothetical protein
MYAPTSNLKNFFDVKLQQSNEKFFKSQILKLWYFVSNILKKTLNLFSLKPHIFFIVSLFRVIKKLWVHQLVIYNIFLNFKCSKTMRKKFNLKIQNYDIMSDLKSYGCVN